MKTLENSFIDFAPGKLTLDDVPASYDVYRDVTPSEELIIGAIEPFQGKHASLTLENESTPDDIQNFRKKAGNVIFRIAVHEGAWDQNWVGEALTSYGLEDEVKQTSTIAKAELFVHPKGREHMQQLGAIHAFRSHIYGPEIAEAAQQPLTDTVVHFAKQGRNPMAFPQGTRSTSSAIQVKSGPGYIIEAIREAGINVGLQAFGLAFEGDANLLDTPVHIFMGDLLEELPKDPQDINRIIEKELLHVQGYAMIAARSLATAIKSR